MANLDRTIPLPLYFQLKQTLMRQLLSGEWRPGQVIPTEKELEARYGVSRITVRRALADLVAEGYLRRQSGRGTFVLKPKLQPRSDQLGTFFEDLSGQGFQIRSDIYLLDCLPPPRSIAIRLGIAEGARLFTFKRLAYADEEPIAMSSVYLNLGENVVLTREELQAGSIYPTLERKYGISLRRAQKTIEATAATVEEAEMLHTVPGAPLLLSEWLVLDDQDRPVIFMNALYRGDRYRHFSVVTR